MLKCEACGHDLEGKTCPDCEAINLPDAVFCSYCGERFPVITSSDSEGGDPYDVENRILCSDEACIGIINEKGVCSDCGKPA